MGDDALVAPARAPGLLRLDEAGLRQLLEAWVAGRNAHTRRAYEQTASDFAGFLSRKSGRPCTAGQALEQLLRGGAGVANLLAVQYRADLLERELAPGTAALRLSNLRAAVRLARTLGLVEWSLEVEGPRVRRYRDTSGPGVRGVQAMAAAARSRGDALGARDRALLAVLFFQGLRRGEVAELDVAHVDFAGGRLSIRGKGELDREWIAATPEALEAVRQWLEVRPGPPEGPLFIFFSGAAKRPGGRLSGRGIAKVTARYGVAALGTAVRPHGLRHAAATALLDLGFTWAEVAGFTRHRDPSTLRHYDDNRAKRGGTAARKLAELVKL